MHLKLAASPALADWQPVLPSVPAAVIHARKLSGSNPGGIIDINNCLPAGEFAVIGISNCPLVGRFALRQMNNRSRAAPPLLPDADNRGPDDQAAVFPLDKRALVLRRREINIANRRRAARPGPIYVHNPKENLSLSNQLTCDTLRAVDLAIQVYVSRATGGSLSLSGPGELQEAVEMLSAYLKRQAAQIQEVSVKVPVKKVLPT